MCLRYVSIRRVSVSVRWCWCKGQYCQPALNSARRGLRGPPRRRAARRARARAPCIPHVAASPEYAARRGASSRRSSIHRAGRAAGSARNFTVLRARAVTTCEARGRCRSGGSAEGIAHGDGQGARRPWRMAHAMFDVACLRATSRMRCTCMDGPMHLGPWRRDRVPDVYTVLCVGQRTYAVARARAVR